MQTNKQKIGCKYNAGNTKILFIHSYFDTPSVSYQQVRQYILKDIVTNKLELISNAYLSDADHLIMNLKILRKNKELELQHQARETVDFVYYIVKSKKRIFEDDIKEAGRNYYDYSKAGKGVSFVYL